VRSRRELIHAVTATLLAPALLLALACTQGSQPSAPASTSVTQAEAPSAQAAVIGSSDFLKASGTQLKNNYGNGSVVSLRGTNLGGWFIQEAWMSPLNTTDEWTLRQTLTNRFGAATKDQIIQAYQDTWIQAADLDNMKNMGMNVVRAPIFYLDMMEANGAWRAAPWTKLDWLVSQCASRGIYVILDLHGTFGGQNGQDNCGETGGNALWTTTLYQDRTVTLWNGIAAHFKGNAAVAGYDLLNEPNNMTGGSSQLCNFYNRLYQGIRANDPDHAIIMEAAWDWNLLPTPSTYGWTNVVYEMHPYDFGNSANWTGQNSSVDWWLSQLQAKKAANNVPYFMGEFCLFDFMDLWGKFLGGLNAQGASWTNWTYKVNGGMGNWGYYNQDSGTIGPNIGSDSAATIIADWKTFTTSHYHVNTTLINAVKPYLVQAPPPVSSYFSIKASANSTFVCAENAGATYLVANRTSAGDWEAFNVITNSDGTISLQSKANGQYVTADLNNGAKLIASRTAIGTWEKFKRVPQSNGTVALQAMANNLYVCADLNVSNVLVADRATPGGWEQFIFTQM